MVAPNPAALPQKSHLLRGWTTSFSHSSTQSKIFTCRPINVNCSNKISITSAANRFEIFGRPEHLRPLSFRVSSGGGGGGGGGSGDGGSGGGGGGGGGGSNWSFLSWYLSLLAKYPVMTKAVTSAILTFVGDVICQLVIDQAPSLDVKRTFIFTLMGLVLVGPTLHAWYLYLSKLVTATGASGAFLWLLLDQEWFSSVLVNWKLWIPFQFLNFLVVPQHFQVLSANSIALIWNVILSSIAHKQVVAK